jgi:Flp pilus assembly protein TadD
MSQPSDSELQLACPVCAAFNPADFRFCPHCGHRLGAPELVKEPSTIRRLLASFFPPLFVFLLLLLVVELGLERSLWPRLSPWLSYWWSSGTPTSTVPMGQTSSAVDEHASLPMVPGLEKDAGPDTIPLDTEVTKTAATSRQPGTVPVEVTLYDREGDRLRQARGILTSQDRRVVTTLDSIHGAYSGAVRLPTNATAAVTTVERTDVTANLAILLLEPSPSTASFPGFTLEALARSTYEDTAAEQRYLAEKRATAQHWDEALAHWKRATELDSSVRRDHQAALVEAFLNASAVALQQGRRTDAHTRLLEAVDWFPEHGRIRLQLAESYAGLGEFREAIEQYWLALDFLPAQAADITKVMLRAYRDWGQALLRQGEFTSAATLFREALQLDATNGELYFALGQAEFRRQALEEAIQAFETALDYEPGLQGEIEPYLTKARALLGGPQTVVITFPPGSMRIEISALLNGSLQLPFIIDTGASMTLIPAWAAEQLGYRAQSTSEWLRVQTAGGPRRLPYASLGRIEIQGLGLSNLPVLFGDLPGYEASRGLLGMDFLRHFSMAVDHDLGRMTLRLP